MFDEFLKWQHRVDQRATVLAREMAQELEASYESIMGKLARLQEKHLKADSFADESFAARRRFLEAQEEQIRALLDDVYANISNQSRRAGADIIKSTAEHTVKTLNGAPGLVVDIPKISKALVVSWFDGTTIDGLTVGDWLSKLQTATQGRILSASRQALIEGLGSRAAARLMRKRGIEGSIPGTENLARTILMSASNYARETTIEGQCSDLLKGWRHVSTLDRRTCLRCGPLDGKEYGLDEARPPLPLHWRCRCTYMPIFKTWKELGVDIREMDERARPAVKHSSRTVHHRDGSTSTAFSVEQVEHFRGTYNEWMRDQLTKDSDFVREVLGKKRFEMFRAGKLRLEAMNG